MGQFHLTPEQSETYKLALRAARDIHVIREKIPGQPWADEWITQMDRIMHQVRSSHASPREKETIGRHD